VRNRLAIWTGPRTLWALGVIVMLLAASPGIAFFVPVATLCAALLVAVVLYDFLTLPKPDRIAVRRELPSHFTLGRPAMLRYAVENRGEHAVHVGIVPAPQRTLQFDATDATATVPRRFAGTIEVPALPVSRGSDAFAAIYLWYESDLGFVRRRVISQGVQRFRVYPDLSAVERYGSLQTRNRLIESGLRRIRMRGTGTEFESLREYADGDAFRTIDWKATARRGKLMVAQQEVERSQDVMLLVDCGRLMTPRIGKWRKLDYAVTAALSLARIASLASDRVGVVAFARRILIARAPRRAAAAIGALADALCDVEPRFEESDYARAFAYLRSHLHRRSFVVMLTDVIDPVAQSMILAELGTLAKRHVVLCIFMNDAAVNEAMRAEPRSVEDAYRLDVALGLLQERRLAARSLERNGIRVLDVPAQTLSVAAIEDYLRVKQLALI
jgi:uncharacterized protein (DUF58 family)